MRHLVKGRKLKRTASHRRALLRNLATALFQHKKLNTTEAKAKELRPFAEKLITKAKNALAREKQGLLPEGQTIDIHNRRIVSREIRSKAVLQELFDAIAPVVAERNGGYTRIIKTGFRRGDAGRTAIIELVDWSAPLDGAASLKKRRRRPSARPVPAVVPAEEQETTISEGDADNISTITESPDVIEDFETVVESTEELVEEGVEIVEKAVAEEEVGEDSEAAEIQAQVSEETPKAVETPADDVKTDDNETDNDIEEKKEN